MNWTILKSIFDETKEDHGFGASGSEESELPRMAVVRADWLVFSIGDIEFLASTTMTVAARENEILRNLLQDTRKRLRIICKRESSDELYPTVTSRVCAKVASMFDMRHYAPSYSSSQLWSEEHGLPAASSFPYGSRSAPLVLHHPASTVLLWTWMYTFPSIQRICNFVYVQHRPKRSSLDISKIVQGF